MEPSVLLPVCVLFLAVAMLYASVGFGGGSSYLALLSLFSQDFLFIKTTALLCNIIVVAGGTYTYFKKGWLDWPLFRPLILTGVPLAYAASYIHLSFPFFFITLGVVLSISGALLLLLPILSKPGTPQKDYPSVVVNGIAATTGFLSGLVGIGGGILLSPILHLMRWNHPRKIAALASLFILVNSTAGISGQVTSNQLTVSWPATAVLLISVLVGGQLGTRLSLTFLNPAYVRACTGLLVFYVGIKLVLRHWLQINI